MHFFHSPALWSAFPALQAGVMHVRGVRGAPDFDDLVIAHAEGVARARGDEEFLAFSGELEHPAPTEMVFVDALGRAHARKWAHRQSSFSAVSSSTESVLIVIEAFHDGAPATVAAGRVPTFAWVG
jgi:hypothetical protein